MCILSMAFGRCVEVKSLLSLFILLGYCSSTLGFNILMSSYYGMGSHFLAGTKVAEGLLKKGHNVSFLISEAYAHRAEDPAYSNFSFHIFKHKVPKEDIINAFGSFAKNAFENSHKQFMKAMNDIVGHNIEDCLTVLRDDVFISNIKEIDGIVVDPAWNCGYFIRDFLELRTNRSRRVPLVAITPTPNQFGSILEDMTTPFNRAYQPELHTGYTNTMTFLQRTINVLMNWKIKIIVLFANSWYCKLQKEVGQSCDNFDALGTYGKADIFLLNSHFAVDFPHALSPNVIFVGGLTTRPAAPLHQELEDFVQSSGDHGVIVFTLGTYTASITTMRPEILVMFAEAFRRLPQKVIWQLKEIPDWELPPNVKTMPWLPQNDLLGHPKTRALIYQGGNNGFQEACYHGVPIVAIPLFGDQPDVAARIEGRGMGKKLDKMSLSADVIYESLVEVIQNPSYSKVAKEVSAIYRDDPMTAPEKAAHWIEHAIKFGGHYMRSPANKLNFFQYHLLDVYAFLIASSAAFLAVVFFIFRFCLFVFINLFTHSENQKFKSE